MKRSSGRFGGCAFGAVFAPAMALLLAMAPVALAPGCATNPATGKRQLSFIGESGEISLGRDSDQEIMASMGLYDDPALQEYVATIGKRMAARSERPTLPWTFRVLDDPVVNAFALPGGYIYVTRGILAYLDSEAELASVLGHEIGHVTARHSVNRMSKAQLLSLGLGIGMMVSPELAEFGDLAETGLGLLFLKYSRDDERQADELGLRYLLRDGYDPNEMPKVFTMLGTVSAASEAGRVPGWLSTHPDPEAREASSRQRIGSLGRDFSGARVERESYLSRIDGIVFGEDPRAGFFEGDLFHHPDLKFSVTFPKGWRTANQRSRVVGQSPAEDAQLLLSLSEEASPDEGRRQFLAPPEIESIRSWDASVHELPASWASFVVSGESGRLNGLVAFVRHGEHVYRLLGFSREAQWSDYSRDIESALGSFRRLTDPAILAIRPARIEMTKVSVSMPLSRFNTKYPSNAPLDTVARLNRLQVDGRLVAGTRIKRVVGGRPSGS